MQACSAKQHPEVFLVNLVVRSCTGRHFARASFVVQSCRKKFRSQLSDNMDRWKSKGGKSQGREEKEVRRSEKRKGEKKEDARAKKVGKSRLTVSFQ